jgi:ketosteroid isomerase-like protein
MPQTHSTVTRMLPRIAAPETRITSLGLPSALATDVWRAWSLTGPRGRRDTGRAMSRDNVVVERAVAAVNARDIDGYLSCCTEEIELRTPWVAVGAVYEGPDGIHRFFADVQDTNPDLRLDIERLEAVGPDRVIAFLRSSARGRASGVDINWSVTNIYDFADGKIRRVRIFLDRQEALEAVGLRE